MSGNGAAPIATGETPVPHTASAKEHRPRGLASVCDSEGRDQTQESAIWHSVNVLAIDDGLRWLAPPLRAGEYAQLEENLRRDGCREPLSVWRHGGATILLDGHNRYEICQRLGIKFLVDEIELPDYEHARLWVCQRQLGRRNLSDDQRAVVANEVRKALAKIGEGRRQARLKRGAKLPAEAKSAPTERARRSVAKAAKLPERKLRLAQEVEQAAPELLARVQAGQLSLVEAKRLATLPKAARATALGEFDAGRDVRSAIRTAKRQDYDQRVAASKPKPLTGTYRILYADPPWKYVGLNQADEYGHAERHYDCLTDEQLCSYRVGGRRPVRELADKNAVLFLWVPSPLLERSFQVVRAWGFEYKASFVWDKVRHNIGHYNSVRHEFLLICTKGSCKPDTPKLVDSVQSIERSATHSEKPSRFYEIIEAMYDHGRRLELFARRQRQGWDVDGNEVVDSRNKQPMFCSRTCRLGRIIGTRRTARWAEPLVGKVR